MNQSTLLHLRIPFSVYLMPFFCFALSQSKGYNLTTLALTFIALHLFLYPASNGYNSYFDKDEESIGGLKQPPPVSKQLFIYALIFDLMAILTGLLVNVEFAVLLVIYGLASKAYSHPAIRLKKYPIAGLFTVVFFQGFFTYLMTSVALNGYSSSIFSYDIVFPAILCSFLLLGSYPMTQIYQHQEDARRGDLTFSRILGIRGTFVWTAVVFMIGTGGFIFYFISRYSLLTAVLFVLFLSPVLIYFMTWVFEIIRDESRADWNSTMQLNQISSVCFISFFVLLTFL